MSKGKTKTQQQTTLPDWQMDLFKDYYERAKEAADVPFEAYTGQRVAGLSPQELQAQAAAQGLFGTAFGYDPTAQLQQLAGQAAPTLGDVPSLLDVDIGAYQSPYQQQVIDLALEDIGRAEDIQRQQAQDVAMRAGAFGGTRGTIYEQEALRPLQEQKLRTVAGLRQAGFEQAQRAAEADIARQQQMAMLAPELELRGRAQQAGLLGGLLGGQQQALGTLAGFGELGRGLQQAQQDFAFQEFMRRQGYPAQQLGLLGMGLGAMPKLLGQSGVTEKFASPLSVGGDILGLAAGLASGGVFGPLSQAGAGASAGTGAAVTAGGGRGYFSDERLKENIKPIGTSENGHKLYTWDWNDKAKELGINDPTTGVMAQEVMKYMPEAVSKNTNGYYMVNYGVL